MRSQESCTLSQKRFSVNSKARHLKLQMSTILFTDFMRRTWNSDVWSRRGTSSLNMWCWVQGQAFLKSSSLMGSLYLRDLPANTPNDSCSRGKPARKGSCSVMGHFLKSSIFKAEISPQTETLLSSGSVFLCQTRNKLAQTSPLLFVMSQHC